MKETYEILKELFEKELDITDFYEILVTQNKISLYATEYSFTPESLKDWDVKTCTNYNITYVDSMSCMINKTEIEVF